MPPLSLCTIFFLLLLFTAADADDSAALLSLAQSLSPLPSGWSSKSASGYCNWSGVNCDSSDRVTSISLPWSQLSGSLPDSISSLSQLKMLSLQFNALSGPIPSLSKLASLEEILLDGNNFSSVPSGCFDGLSNLQTLILSRNSLSPWPFPQELIKFTGLITLYLDDTNLMGSIPDIFDSFANLQNVRLSYNNLTGSLPPSFAKSEIQYLWLNHQEMGLSGTLDVLSTMTQLKQVWLHNNKLSGPIPDLSKCESLFDLSLLDNQLTGVIPDSVISLPALVNVSLINNKLQGPYPVFPSRVQQISVKNNNFCLNRSQAGKPCDPQFTTMLQIAAAMGYPIVLADSWPGNNACSDWSFVTCDAQGRIISINLANKKLSGTISPAYANLTALKSLYLQQNNLTGPIPDSLTKIATLENLDVSNNNISGKLPSFGGNVKLTVSPGNPFIGTDIDTTPNSPWGSSDGASGSGKGVRTSRISPVNLVIGTVTAIGGLTLVIIFCIFKWKKKSVMFWKKTKNDHLEAFIKNYGSLAPKRYSFSNVKKMTNSFKNKLGQGGYGGVYKGQLQDGRLVAVKLLNTSKGNGQEFINEVASISRTSHVNVVTLLGFCLEGNKRALIYEFMPNGSLEKLIYCNNTLKTDRHLGWENLDQIALGIARGLEYLHRGCSTRILHFDIKPHNILLDEDLCPKIADFGLAKLCPRKESNVSMLQARGTIGYTAPEIFNRNFGDVSHKADVYSYGMMILEMVGGRKNLHLEVENSSEIYFPKWIYKHLELGKEINLQDTKTSEENEIAKKMIIVGLWCIQILPPDRPSMNKVIDMLQGSIEALQIPPDPFNSSSPRPTLMDSTTISIS